MKTNKSQEYISPEVKVVEVLVEKGFVISAIILDRKQNIMEKHHVDEDMVEW